MAKTLLQYLDDFNDFICKERETMTRVSRWECDQCGAHITEKGRLYRVRLEEPAPEKNKEEVMPGKWATIPRVKCRNKHVCHACYDKVLFFLKSLGKI